MHNENTPVAAGTLEKREPSRMGQQVDYLHSLAGRLDRLAHRYERTLDRLRGPQPPSPDPLPETVSEGMPGPLLSQLDYLNENLERSIIRLESCDEELDRTT